MAGVDIIADSTDWLPTPLAAIAPLESSLRCQVCKDFFTTPMITSCSHTFCSLCIRRYLSQEGRCPACREHDQEMKLRRNWVVEELVTNFTASRQELLNIAKYKAAKGSQNTLDGERPRKRQKVAANSVNGAGRSTRSRTKKLTSETAEHSLPSTQEEIADSDDGSLYEDSTGHSPQVNSGHDQSDGRVTCPCCGRRMKETMINSHLDGCIAGESRTPVEELPSMPPGKPQITGSIAYSQTKPPKQKDRLPFINYTLLNDNAMRKKLRELGIPNHGSKELMRKRHTEWVNLWNANCDSREPEPKSKLLRDLDAWERTLGRQLDRGPSGVMVKDFDREEYAKTQKSDFNDLIAKARQRSAVARHRTEEHSAESGAASMSESDSVVPPEQPMENQSSLHEVNNDESANNLRLASVMVPGTLSNHHHPADFVHLDPPKAPQPDLSLSQNSINQDVVI